MFNEFGNRHYNHFYNLALGGHVDFPVDQNDFTSLTEWTTSYPEWHKKCLEKVNQSATIEVKINVEQVMMATKEPRLSVSDILASIGKFILFFCSYQNYASQKSKYLQVDLSDFSQE